MTLAVLDGNSNPVNVASTTQGGEEVVHHRIVSGAAGSALNDVIYVRGEADHDAAATGYPVPLGARGDIAQRTAVGTGDIVGLAATRHGELFVVPENVAPSLVDVIELTTQTEAAIISGGGPGSGNTYVITEILVSNASAETGEVIFKQSSTDNEKIVLPAGSDGGGGRFKGRWVVGVNKDPTLIWNGAIAGLGGAGPHGSYNVAVRVTVVYHVEIAS